MASINVDEKGQELWRASQNGKKDKVKAMIEALSPREEWTQVLNWQDVSNVSLVEKGAASHRVLLDRGTGGRRCTRPSGTTGSRSSRSWWGRGRI